jgi:hypothetical protein
LFVLNALQSFFLYYLAFERGKVRPGGGNLFPELASTSEKLPPTVASKKT